MKKSGQKKNSDNKKKRRVVAVGDLHGDYARLLRIIYENKILLEGTEVWDPEANNIDFILIGDYVDWRGEPLEGDSSRWKEGPKKILHLLYYLTKKLKQWREKDSQFDSYIYPMLGNHDQMMLDATEVFKFMTFDQLRKVVRFKQNYGPLKKFLNEINLEYEQIEKVMKFLNWYYQGGEATIEGFGGLEEWKNEMEGELGEFLRENLILGVSINNRLYSHSLPDQREFWRPIDEITNLPDKEKEKARDAFLWGRRIWGIDAYTNMKTEQPKTDEVEEMLSRMGVQGAVVGHTPMLRREPVQAFDGRIINIDLHGIPGSGIYTEEYEVE